MRVSVLLGLTLLASVAWAEPTFLARQYSRCEACHYSPTGGGLLTPYGRLLSQRELSTVGGDAEVPEQGADDDRHGEQAFLYGALGDALGPLRLGLDLRPSHLRIDGGAGYQDLNLLMNMDLAGALQRNGWTAYATAGREPPGAATRNGHTLPDAAFISYEHWLSFQTGRGLGVRVGRFLPAYGVRFADHTAYSRRDLGLDRNDQVYGLEISYSGQASLVQVTASPGRAEALLHDRDQRGFSAAGRWQLDLTPRATIIGSALFRRSTAVAPQSGAVGFAFGLAPAGRVSIWTEGDADLQPDSAGGRSWVVVNETAVEVYRGIWLKFSPQLRAPSQASDASNRWRLALAADLLPRTHWNVNLAYYRDRASGAVTSVFLGQLHLYL